MKKILASTVLGLIASMSIWAGSPNSLPHAYLSAGGFYTSVEGGVALIGGAIGPNETYSNDFHTGYNVGVDIGYDVTNNIKTEFQFLYISHNNNLAGQAYLGSKGSFYQFVYMGNALYEFDNGRFNPYVGAGLGYADARTTRNVAPLEGGFAFQIIAGIEYRFDQHFGMLLDYHFVNITGITVKPDHDAPCYNLINLGLNYYF